MLIIYNMWHLKVNLYRIKLNFIFKPHQLGYDFASLH